MRGAISGAGVGAESPLPFSTANFRASAKVGGLAFGIAAPIPCFLRVLRVGAGGTFFTCRKRRGIRFQPLAVHVQPTLRNSPFVMLRPVSGRSNHAIGGLPCFLNKSLIASVSKASVVLSLSTAKPFSCLCAAGSSVAVTFFFPARVAA